MKRSERTLSTPQWWRIILGLMLVITGIAAYRLGWVTSVDTVSLLRYEPGSYAVSEYIDGDTIMVDMNGTIETIRFIGVDTPETHKPDTPVQCYGPVAAAYTKRRIGEAGGRVRLVADRLTTNRDRYDRLLRYVYLPDGTNLNADLVQHGYGFAYDFPFARSREFHTMQGTAQATKTGLWGSCEPYQIPATGQWQSNPAVSTE